MIIIIKDVNLNMIILYQSFKYVLLNVSNCNKKHNKTKGALNKEERNEIGSYSLRVNKHNIIN